MVLPVETFITLAFVNETTNKIKYIDRDNKKLEEIKILIEYINKANLKLQIGETIIDSLNEIAYIIYKISYTPFYNKCCITYHCVDSFTYPLLMKLKEKPKEIKKEPEW